jgi:hypothetical protein
LFIYLYTQLIGESSFMVKPASATQPVVKPPVKKVIATTPATPQARPGAVANNTTATPTPAQVIAKATNGQPNLKDRVTQVTTPSPPPSRGFSVSIGLDRDKLATAAEVATNIGIIAGGAAIAHTGCLALAAASNIASPLVFGICEVGVNAAFGYVAGYDGNMMGQVVRNGTDNLDNKAATNAGLVGAAVNAGLPLAGRVLSEYTLGPALKLLPSTNAKIAAIQTVEALNTPCGANGIYAASTSIVGSLANRQAISPVTTAEALVQGCVAGTLVHNAVVPPKQTPSVTPVPAPAPAQPAARVRTITPEAPKAAPLRRTLAMPTAPEMRSAPGMRPSSPERPAAPAVSTTGRPAAPAVSTTGRPAAPVQTQSNTANTLIAPNISVVKPNVVTPAVLNTELQAVDTLFTKLPSKTPASPTLPLPPEIQLLRNQAEPILKRAAGILDPKAFGTYIEMVKATLKKGDLASYKTALNAMERAAAEGAAGNVASALPAPPNLFAPPNPFTPQPAVSP